MFCEKCGAKLKPEDKFCPECGNIVERNHFVYAQDEEIQDFSEDTDRDITETDVFSWDDQSYKVPDTSVDRNTEKKTIKWIITVSISIIFLFVIAVLVWSVARQRFTRSQYNVEVQAEKNQTLIKAENSTDMLTPKASEELSSVPTQQPQPTIAPVEVEIPVFSGEQRAAEIERPAQEDYILPESSSTYLSQSQLNGLTKEEFLYARNEIYARHGRIFVDTNIQAYFNSKNWYTPIYNAEEFDANQDNFFNDYEKKNVELILKEEKSRGYL